MLSRSWVATSGAHVSTQTFSVTRPATSCLPPLTELNSKQPENGVLISECSQGKYPIPPNLVGQRVPYNVNTPEQYKPGMENAWTVSSTNKKIKVSERHLSECMVTRAPNPVLSPWRDTDSRHCPRLGLNDAPLQSYAQTQIPDPSVWLFHIGSWSCWRCFVRGISFHTEK